MTDRPTGKPLPVLPSGLTWAGERSPCELHSCRLCCFDTQMPLLDADVERLSAATGRTAADFSRVDDEGTARLVNVDGQCTFLGPTGCTVYEHRPAGCRLYPLVLDPDAGQAVLDDDCPHTKAFRVRPRDRAALGELVDALGFS